MAHIGLPISIQTETSVGLPLPVSPFSLTLPPPIYPGIQSFDLYITKDRYQKLEDTATQAALLPMFSISCVVNFSVWTTGDDPEGKGSGNQPTRSDLLQAKQKASELLNGRKMMLGWKELLMDELGNYQVTHQQLENKERRRRRRRLFG